MDLHKLAAEHRAAVENKTTTLGFWEWLSAAKGAKGNSALEIEASLRGVTLDRAPEPAEEENFLDRAARKHPLWSKYQDACRAQKVEATPDGFWEFDFRTIEGDSHAVGSTAGDFGWADVWARINAEARPRRPSKNTGDVPRVQTTAPLDAKPAQDKWPAATLTPAEVMAAVNAENRQI